MTARERTHKLVNQSSHKKLPIKKFMVASKDKNYVKERFQNVVRGFLRA